MLLGCFLPFACLTPPPQAVDFNCALEIKVDDTVVLPKKEIVLRICNPPMDCRILVLSVPAGAKTIRATLFVGDDDTKTADLAFLTEGGDDTMDDVCALETISELQAQAFAQVAAALGSRDFKRAMAANEEGIKGIRALFGNMVAVEQAVADAAKEFEDQMQAIIQSQEDHHAARETELRAMSRSSTVRNGGVSIDPMMTRSLSELQTQLSEA